MVWLMSGKYLQGGDDVTLGDAGHCTEIFYAESASKVSQDLKEDPGPI